MVGQICWLSFRQPRTKAPPTGTGTVCRLSLALTRFVSIPPYDKNNVKKLTSSLVSSNYGTMSGSFFGSGLSDDSSSEEDPLLFAPVDEDDMFAATEVTSHLALDTASTASAAVASVQRPPPTPFGAVVNLCSATLGAGILSLPFAFYQTGVVLGLVLLGVAGSMTALSIDLLAHAASYAQYTGDSYEELAERVIGQRLSIEVCMLVFCIGCAVAYIMAVGGILTSAIGEQHEKVALVIVWATTMVPLSLLRSMKALSSASAIGLASIGTLIFCSTVDYFIIPNTLSLEDYTLPSSGWKSVLTALPVVLFAFSCQPNVCTIYRELEGPEEQKRHAMQRVAISAVTMCGVLYTAVGIVVLATFGSEVLPNLLSNYHSKGSFMQVAVGAMALAVTLAYPLNIFPARVTVMGLWRKRAASNRTANENLTQALLEDAQDVEENQDEENDDEDETIYRASDPIHSGPSDDEASENMLLHYGTTILLTTLTLVLALVLPNISVVFGLLGGTASSWLGFVIPGWLGVRTGRPWAGYGLLITGVVIGVVTTAVTVYDTIL